MFHEMSRALFAPHGYTGANWAMSMAERFAFVGLLQHARPRLAIEIGTLDGGSLGVLAHHAERVISFDPNPEVAARLAGKHANVELRTESSLDALPGLIEELNSQGTELNFALVDGDHSEAGVFADISALLRYRPVGPFWIVMHDSFNPDCRRAMKRIDWAAHPHVHWVDFDFVPGFLNSVPDWEDEMWCGLAVAYLRPEPRSGDLPTDELLGRQFERFLPLSPHAEK
jgi:cephalosporin hydroxylase